MDLLSEGDDQRPLSIMVTKAATCNKSMMFVCERILLYFLINLFTEQQNQTMRAIIPVAGVGSRLRPHTYSVPKVLLNVAGKPIVGHILDKIIEAGFDEATIIVGYLGEMVKEIRSKKL